MRAYFFTNMYLSSLQQGLQSAHCISNMFSKYRFNPTYEQLSDWASIHKTIIILNGGFSYQLSEIASLLNYPDNSYPHDTFNESEEALNGALTCVGIVVPEKIYEGASFIRNDRTLSTSVSIHLDLFLHSDDPLNHLNKEVNWKYNEWEIRLMKEMNKYGLAK